MSAMLSAEARRVPDQPFILFEDGDLWSYAEAHERVARVASALRALGAGAGSPIVSWLPNGPEALLLWLASSYVGAIFVPLNTAFRGDTIRHVLANCEPVISVVHEALLPRLSREAESHAGRILVLSEGGGETSRDNACQTLFRSDAEPFYPESFPEPWDIQSITYTSGTTGMPKGVVTRYLQLYMGSKGYDFLSSTDRALVVLPLFHTGGQGAVYRMLARGASLVLCKRYRTQEFWKFVNRHEVSFVTLLGAMAAFLVEQREAPDENSLRHALVVPYDRAAMEFGRRFGADIYTNYNMTELCSPIFSDANPESFGFCGRARPGFDIRIVDANDQEVETGMAGELAVRASMPWTISTGYHRDPEATVAAWRNGWFHTGDRFRVDEAGNFYFLGRLRDTIRRRGENISASQVEDAIRSHPKVRDAAVVGVPSRYGEEDILAVLELNDALSSEALMAYLAERLPYFMVPRYVRVVGELPRTGSQKTQKYLLQEEGVTADTWDREAAGYRIRADRLEGE